MATVIKKITFNCPRICCLSFSPSSLSASAGWWQSSGLVHNRGSLDIPGMVFLSEKPASTWCCQDLCLADKALGWLPLCLHPTICHLDGTVHLHCCYTKRKLLCQNKTLKLSGYCCISEPSGPASQSRVPYIHPHTFALTFAKSQRQHREQQGGMAQVQVCSALITTWNTEVGLKWELHACRGTGNVLADLEVLALRSLGDGRLTWAYRSSILGICPALSGEGTSSGPALRTPAILKFTTPAVLGWLRTCFTFNFIQYNKTQYKKIHSSKDCCIIGESTSVFL